MMRFTLRHIFAAATLPLLALASCMDDNASSDSRDIANWRAKNEAYLIEAENETQGGVKVYEKVVPSWMPTGYVLMKWHNDRELTQNNLTPLYNSTVDVIYEGELVDGTVFDKSANHFANGVFTSQPSQNIAGMAVALTNMHVGDSVTMVIPYDLAYGAYGSGTIRGYSTLIFHVRLKDVAAYDKQ